MNKLANLSEPKILWQRVPAFPGQLAFQLINDSLCVLISDKVEYDDGKLWRHVSFSRPNRMPSYDDMMRVKLDFIGENCKAIMVLPAKSEHVNIHDYCLHLYAPINHDPLPDFTMGSGMI